MIYWMLAREVLILKGKHPFDKDWDVCVDLFYYKKEEQQPDKEDIKELKEGDEEQVAESYFYFLIFNILKLVKFLFIPFTTHSCK